MSVRDFTGGKNMKNMFTLKSPRHIDGKHVAHCVASAQASNLTHSKHFEPEYFSTSRRSDRD